MAISQVLFAVLVLLVGFSALGVVFSRNIVRAAVWLLFTLIGVSGLYFYLGAEFLGAAQLIVYVGGTLVLVVFGVMLTAQGPFRTDAIKLPETIFASIVAIVFFGLLVMMSLRFGERIPENQLTSNPAGTSVGELGLSFLNITDVSPQETLIGLTDLPEDFPDPKRASNAYLLPFEILSVHLLVVLIGAAYLARAKRRAATVKKEATP